MPVPLPFVVVACTGEVGGGCGAGPGREWSMAELSSHRAGCDPAGPGLPGEGAAVQCAGEQGVVHTQVGQRRCQPDRALLHSRTAHCRTARPRRADRSTWPTRPLPHCCRHCQYPQELVVRLDQPAQLTQIQLLSHEFKVRAACWWAPGAWNGSLAARLRWWTTAQNLMSCRNGALKLKVTQRALVPLWHGLAANTSRAGPSRRPAAATDRRQGGGTCGHAAGGVHRPGGHALAAPGAPVLRLQRAQPAVGAGAEECGAGRRARAARALPVCALPRQPPQPVWPGGCWARWLQNGKSRSALYGTCSCRGFPCLGCLTALFGLLGAVLSELCRRVFLAAWQHRQDKMPPLSAHRRWASLHLTSSGSRSASRWPASPAARRRCPQCHRWPASA